jgi:hypothetical protein
MRACISLVFVLTMSNACVLSMADQTLRTQRESVPAAALTAARLETGAGSLTVTGRNGAATVEVTAEYRASVRSESEAQRILDNLKLTVEVRGDTLYLKTEQIRSWDWGDSGRIDLTITMPATLTLDIDDGSGSIEVSGMDRDVKIEDGSGEIEIENLRGNLIIDDGSGEIRIRDVRGNIDIDDGSGEIEVEHVGGSVHILDRSGSIDVTDIEGDLVVPDGGSGSLHYQDIRGKVDVPRKK